MAKINCSVDSCVYHGRGDVCEADSIMVRNNSDRRYDMEIGAIAGEEGAETSAETMCETFKPHPRRREDES